MAKPKGNWSDSLFLPTKVKYRPSPALKAAVKKNCAYCGDLMQGHGASKPTRDHVVPKSKGHTLLHNKVICCYDCNQRKGNRSLVEWLIVLAKKADPKNVERARRVNMLIQQRHRAGLKIDHLDDRTSTTA